MFDNFRKIKKTLKTDNLDSIAYEIKNKSKKPKDHISELWLPSVSTIFFIISIFISIFSLDKFFDFFKVEWLDSLVIKMYNTFDIENINLLINVHTGIWAIVIGLAFFVAQSLTDENEPNKGRVLLKESAFLPLLFSEILMSVSLLIKGFYFSKFIITLLMCAFIIYSLFKVMKVLTSNYKMDVYVSKVLLDVVKNNFFKIIEKSILERKGNSLLYKFQKRLIGFNESPLSLVTKEPISFFSNTTGTVIDVSRLKLTQFSEKLKRVVEDSSNGQSMNFASINDSQISLDEAQSTLYKCSLKVKFLQNVKPNSKLIDLYLNDEIEISDEVVQQLEIDVRNIFTVKATEDIESKARHETTLLKQFCLDAIKNEELTKVEKGLNLYRSLILELEKYFSKTELEIIDSPSRINFLSFSPIDWIINDISDVYRFGIQRSTEEIGNEIIYLPIEIAMNSVESRNVMLFDKFIKFHSTLYYLYLQKEKGYESYLDSSCSHLVDIANFYINSILDESDGELKLFYHYTLEVFFEFNQLLKLSIEFNELSNFKLFIKKISLLYKHINRSLIDYETLNEIANNIQQLKQELIFGNGSWIFNLRLNKDKFNDEEVKEYYQSFSKLLPNDIGDLINLYLKCQRDRFENSWGWNTRLLSKDNVGTAKYIDTDGMFTHLFVYHAIQILKPISLEALSKHIVLDKDDSVSYISKNSRIDNLILEFSNKPEDIPNLFKPDVFDNLTKLQTILEKTAYYYERKRKLQIRESSIDEGIIKPFLNAIYSEFENESELRKLLKYHKLYKDYSNSDKISKLDNIFILDRRNKSTFINRNFDTDNGLGIGKAMAYKEAREIQEQIAEKCKLIDEHELIDILGAKNGSKFIILTNNYTLSEFFNHLEIYKSIKNQSYGLTGHLEIGKNHIPVYNCYLGNFKSALILRKDKFGKLIQYKARSTEESESKDYQFGELIINFIDLYKDTKFKNHIKKKSPELMTSGKEEKEIDEFLESLVFIGVNQNFKLKFKKSFEGYYLNEIKGRGVNGGT